MKIVSFNINGLRARLHQLQAIVDKYHPDIIGLQETKVDDSQFPLVDLKQMGYHVEFFGQKSHYGVALLSIKPPIEIHKGFPTDSALAQRRLIFGVYEDDKGQPLTVMNGYFPQGENRAHPIKFPAKKRFYADLLTYLEQSKQPIQPLVIMGDFNISPQDCDIGIGEKNAKRWLQTGKCSFLPEEREWMGKLLKWGLMDSYRTLYPNLVDRLSWFPYRSRGFEDTPKRGLRIDLILSSLALKDRLQAAGIDYDIRAMEKPSDHCPIWLVLK